jgi:hypothetical protein
MAKQFYCKWFFDMPLHERKFLVQTTERIFRCREQAAYSLNNALHRQIRSEVFERDSIIGMDITIGRVFEGFDAFSSEAAYFWYLRSQAVLVCETAIDRTDVVAEALEDIRQCIGNLYPNVALSVIDRAMDTGLIGKTEAGLRIEGDITVYSAFYITQLLLRYAFYADSFSDYKSNIDKLDYDDKRTFDFLSKNRDRLVECAAYQLANGVGPLHTAMRNSLPSYYGAKEPHVTAQTFIDNLMAVMK